MDAPTLSDLLCSYIYRSGPKRGAQCSIAPNKGNHYCHKHGKTQQALGKVKAAPVPKIVKTKDERREEQMAKLRANPDFDGAVKPAAASIPNPNESRTTWLVTLNSNKIYDKLGAEGSRNFKSLTDFLFDPANLRDFLELPGDLLDLRTEHHYELSSTGALHVHGIITSVVQGPQPAQLRANDVRRFYNEILGYNIYLNAPIVRDEVQSWVNYMRKNQASANPAK